MSGMLRIGRLHLVSLILAITCATASLAAAQTPPAYQPKFKGDPARSEAEAEALGYMRVVVRAQKTYKKRHDK